MVAQVAAQLGRLAVAQALVAAALSLEALVILLALLFRADHLIHLTMAAVAAVVAVIGAAAPAVTDRLQIAAAVVALATLTQHLSVLAFCMAVLEQRRGTVQTLCVEATAMLALRRVRELKGYSI